MDKKIIDSIASSYNLLSNEEIEKICEIIYEHDGDAVLSKTYNRWYFYKFCDNTIRVSRLTWEFGDPYLESFNTMIAWLKAYYTDGD